MDKFFELRDIHFTYPGGRTILNGINLDLHKGQRLAITGANGAGKSTLFHIMIGLKKPKAGQVTAFGQTRVQEKDFTEVRQRAGLVFQDPDDQLFCPTVTEDIAFGLFNLGLSKDAALERVERTLSELNLQHLKDRATHNLSGGEKRLVSLATVLTMEPDVLMLDEPTNALDEKTRDRLIEILNALPQSILLISHDAHFRRRITEDYLLLEDGHLTRPHPKCSHAKPA